MLLFTNRRYPASVDQLDAIGREQLRICGERWDGEDLPAEQRLFATDIEIETNFYTMMLARWDVVEDGAQVYDAWFFAVDSGLVFRSGTTVVVCIVIQFDFQSEADPRLATDLAEAARRANAI